MTAPSAAGTIELRVDDLSQLFNTLDAFPFRERDLDKDAEEFIVGWARELPKDHPIKIVVHVARPAEKPLADQDVAQALTRYFDYRRGIVALDLKELFRIGRRALLIGLAVLGLCVVGGQALAGLLEPSKFARVAEEGLLILGWVVNWKPIEIFLYDWWPIAQRRNLYTRLSRASVEIVQD